MINLYNLCSGCELVKIILQRICDVNLFNGSLYHFVFYCFALQK